MEAEASGGDGDRQLPRYTKLLDEAGQCLAKVIQRGFLGVALAMRSQAGAQLGVGAPHPVLVALDDDRQSYRTRLRHATTVAGAGGRPSDAPGSAIAS